MTWDQRHWLEDSKTFPKCSRTWAKLKNWASYALWKLGNFWIFWKVNIASNDLKLLMGPFFFHNSSSMACARPLGPKGSISSFFIYLFEFLFIIIHLNQIKYMKNANLSFPIFLYMFYPQDFVHMQIRKDLDWLAWLRTKNTWKRYEKDLKKSNIQNPWLQEIWLSFS